MFAGSLNKAIALNVNVALAEQNGPDLGCKGPLLDANIRYS